MLRPILGNRLKGMTTLTQGGGGEATAPAQFGAGDWSVADDETVDGALLTISTLPSDGGSAITDLEYQVDGGSWVSLGDTTTGPYGITGLTYNTSQSIAIRAVNAIGNGDPSATKSVTPTGLPETDALIARFTTPPTTARAKAINTFIGSLINAGVWAKLDCLYVTAAADSQAARRNWVQDAHNLTAVNSPTFTADRGYAGNGSTSYLNTNYNPLTNGQQYTLNSAHVSVYNRTSRAANDTIIMGAASSGGGGVEIYPRFTGDLLPTFVNDQSGSVPNAFSDGDFLGSRISPTRSTYRNGSFLGALTPTLTAVPNSNVFICCRSINGSPNGLTTDQVSGGSLGAGLDATEVAAFAAARLAYLQAVGAA